MALVTMVGTWGSTGHRDILLTALGERGGWLTFRASSSILVEFTSLLSTKDTSELEILVGEMEVGKE